jgi:hypothetical protein
MLQTFLQFRNADSTQNINSMLSGFLKRGIISGGLITPVSGQLQVQVSPFKLIGYDGMVVLETSNTVTLNVVAGQTNVVVFNSQYVSNSNPIAQWEVLELSVYQGRSDINYLTVFGYVTLLSTDTQVSPSEISYQYRDELDPLQRLIVRGTVTSIAGLPTQNNRPGDTYIITSGLGDTPALYTWNGANFLNLTDTLTLASLLSAHRNNLFSNEIHLTDEQALAVKGTHGIPGVEPIIVTANVATSVFTLANPLSDNNLVNGSTVILSTTGILPAGVIAGTVYYAIPLTSTTFYLATSAANAAANIAITLGGVQAGVHTAQFVGNQFVTSTDTRMASFSEAAAFVGLPSTPVPSGTNPYVTGAYSLAAPGQKGVVGSGPFVLTLSDGPVFVGTGGAGTAQQYFKIYLSNLQREYVDPNTGIPAIVINVFKDSGLTQPLVPSAEPTVIASKGFYSASPLYITATSVLAQSGILRYGQQQTLQNINPGAFLFPSPMEAQTTQEVLEKFYQVTGRQFDAVVPFNEQNINLRSDLNKLQQYIATTLAGNLVISNQQFDLMREYLLYADQYVANLNDTQLVPGGYQFTVVNDTGDYSGFGITPDLAKTAVVVYSPTIPAGLSSVYPGCIFVDSNGNQFRVLNNALTDRILIYTGGRAVGSLQTDAAAAVYNGANPRQLELSYDFRTQLAREVIPVQGVQSIANGFEELPPGGNANGPGGTITMIGPNILYNNGSISGTVAGRPIYEILPNVSNARPEERVILIGGWINSDQYDSRYAIGDLSQGALGIEYTGKIQELTLMTSISDLSDYNIRVFVDGKYTTTYDPQNLLLSEAISSVRYPTGEAPIQKLRLPLALGGNFHTVRLEVTTESGVTGATGLFPLSGIEIYYGSNVLQTGPVLNIEEGSAFINMQFSAQNAAFQNVDPLYSHSGPGSSGIGQLGGKVVQFLDNSTLNMNQAIQQGPGYQFPTTISGNQITLPASGASVYTGDVLRVSTRDTSGGQDNNSDVTLRVLQSVPVAGTTATLEQSFPSGTTLYQVEYCYRIPTSTDVNGSPQVGAPNTDTDMEYARFLVSDWNGGNSGDISQSINGLEDTRVTVLDDAVTALAMKSCSLVNTNIAGYINGLSMTSSTSQLAHQFWGTRLDVVFCGTQGPATVTIDIDGGTNYGGYSYNLTISGTGVERHACFMAGQPQVHSVVIRNPTATGKVVIGQWIMHDLARPQITGLPLVEYTIEKSLNAYHENSQSIGWTYTSANSPFATSPSGVVVKDITKIAMLQEGSSAGSGWSLVEDLNINPRFGYYLTTTKGAVGASPGATASVNFVGSMFELYFQDVGTTGDQIQFYLTGSDGIQQPLNNINYTGSFAVHPQGSGNGQFSLNSGIYKKLGDNAYRRLVCLGLPYDSYTLSIVNVNSSEVRLLAFAENALTYQVTKRNLEDTSASRLNLSSFQDLRAVESVTAWQIGSLGGGQGSSAVTKPTTQTPYDIPPQSPAPGFSAVMSNAFLTTPGGSNPQIDLTRTNAAWNPTFKMFTMDVAHNVSVTTSGTTFTINNVISAFNVKAGDVILNYSTQEWHVISSISGSSGLLDVAFATNLSNQLCMVSQAVWTTDLVNVGDPAQATRARDFFPAADIQVIHLNYLDSLSPTDNNPDMTVAPYVVCAASNSGLQTDTGTPLTSTFSQIFKRPIAPGIYNDYPLNTVGNDQRLFVVFFNNPSDTSVTKSNLIRYDISFVQNQLISNGGILNSAYTYTDNTTGGATTPINCSAPFNDGSGLTNLVLSFPYIMNVNSGTPDGDLRVKYNGLEVKRFVAGAMKPYELYFVEVNPYQIQFSKDIITGFAALELSVIRQQGQNDGSLANARLLNRLAPIVVGTPQDVSMGVAQYSSLQTAINNSPPNQRIILLSGVFTETVVFDKPLTIQGLNGSASQINGTVTLNVGSGLSTILGINVGQFIIYSNGNIIQNCFWTTDPADNGVGNLISGVTL